MKRISSFALFSFVLVIAAVDASAQCRDCRWSTSLDCYECVNTTASASVLCTIIYNGEGCRLEGSCTGNDEWCRYYPDSCPENPLRESSPTLRGEWKLVAVEIVRARRESSRKRPS